MIYALSSTGSCGRIAAAVLFALALTLSSASQAKPERYEIDPDHFVIAFSVKHIGFANVMGWFLEAEGGFTYDEDTKTLSDLKVVIEADSVFTNHKKRDGHVRSADFLDASRHEEIVFIGTQSEETGPNSGKVHGSLTVRGVTRLITLDVILNQAADYPFGHGDYVLGLSAHTVLKRSEFGMTYALGGGIVGDNVNVVIELEARQK